MNSTYSFNILFEDAEIRIVREVPYEKGNYLEIEIEDKDANRILITDNIKNKDKYKKGLTGTFKIHASVERNEKHYFCYATLKVVSFKTKE